LYLGLAVLAPFANFYVLGRLVVPGDATATAQRLMSNEVLFRSGIASFVIAAILDVALAWALYVVLKPVNKTLALLAAWLRLAYAIMFVIAVQSLVSALQLLSGADYLKVVQQGTLNALALQSLDTFTTMWDIALVAFGLHLILVGYLVFRSTFLPRLIGVLLIIAGVGYLVQSFATLLLPFPGLGVDLSLVTGWGELLFTFWLLIRGVNVEQWEKRAGESA
jgi:hypothetical protein